MLDVLHHAIQEAAWAMPFSMTCEGCQKQFYLPDEIAGKRFKCSGCSHIIQAPEIRETNEGQEVLDAVIPNTLNQPPSQPRRRERQQNHPARGSKASKTGRKRRRALPDPDVDVFTGPAIGSYGHSVGIPRAIERELEAEVTRENRPELFENFDSLISEIVIFFTGFGIISAAIGCVIFAVMDEGKGGPVAGLPLYFAFLLGLSAVLITMAMLSLTRVPFVLGGLSALSFSLAVICCVIVFMLETWLLFPIPFSLFVAMQRLQRAWSLHP